MWKNQHYLKGFCPNPLGISLPDQRESFSAAHRLAQNFDQVCQWRVELYSQSCFRILSMNSELLLRYFRKILHIGLWLFTNKCCREKHFLCKKPFFSEHNETFFSQKRWSNDTIKIKLFEKAIAIKISSNNLIKDFFINYICVLMTLIINFT